MVRPTSRVPLLLLTGTWACGCGRTSAEGTSPVPAAIPEPPSAPPATAASSAPEPEVAPSASTSLEASAPSATARATPRANEGPEGFAYGEAFNLGHGAGTGHGQDWDLHPAIAPPSTAKLTIGDTTVAGTLPPEVIRKIVAQNKGRFRLCYDQGLRTDATLHGELDVHFVIDRSGAVSTANTAASTTLPDAAVVACVTRGFGNLSFPQPDSGTVDVVYRMKLTPK